ncbi:MAG: VWA domain-containing protein [Treponema sp.]|nr:VWA domain-containing protein [Treponema sp.]MCL2237162.1 VWA domain-containing protein [Treponema sp.]
MKKCLILSLFLACFPVFAQDLGINADDLLLESRADGGFHLFVRKKPDVGSVLLTETTRDPNMRADNYAYRAGEWNAINGDEIRMLNGAPIPRESRVFSLISSTVVNHPSLGNAFHIYIPYVLYYGYEGGRSGQVHITDGTFLNVRAFSMPYADYRGSFRDNPFRLEARQEPLPGPPGGEYMAETVAAFTEIARSANGESIYSRGPEDVVNLIRTVLERERGNTLDLVICIDTTNSMNKYIDSVRQRLIPMLDEMLGGFPSFRIGMVQFKDYYESYVTRVIPFTNNFAHFQRDLNAIRVHGGGDIPEAVYEALHEGAVRFDWQAQSRIMILIGDAPPHPRPRGRITKTMVDNAVNERNIKVHTMILPH